MATILATANTPTAVQTAIGTANTGDVVQIPATSATWTSGVTCTKSISIVGLGYTPNTVTGGTSPGSPSLSTVINYTPTSGNAFTVTSASTGTATFRLSGISFTGAVSVQSPTNSTANYVNITSSTTSDPWRVDNCSMVGTGTQQVVMFSTQGNPVGSVCDHCLFSGGAASEMIHNNAVGADNTAGWIDNVAPGSNQLLYFEDCLWQQTSGWNSIAAETGCSGIESYYGARNCIRYSTFQLVQIDQHGGQSEPGARWWEFYNLTFVMSAAGIALGDGMSDFALRGGSGFVYNFTCLPSNGIHTASIYSDQVTPCTFGPGNGIFVSGAGHNPDNSSPVYMWALPSNLTVSTQPGVSGSNDIALGRNYFISSTQPTNKTVWQSNSGAVANYVYTPFTYPHPLAASVTPVPVLVNHVASGMENLYVQQFTANFPDPVLPNNCLVCFTQISSTGPSGVNAISSVKDNLGNSFSLASSFNSTSFGRMGACYVLPNATSGVTGVTVTYAGFSTFPGDNGLSTAYPQIDISQWANIATSLPVDVVATSVSSKSVSLTTLTAGDLILHWSFDLSNTNPNGGNFNGSAIAGGSGQWKLITADCQVGAMVQYQVQTAAGNITPACTTSGTATWGSIAVALKAASAGTLPSSTQMRIVNEYHCSFSGNNTTVDSNFRPFTQLSTLQFPTTGNLIVGSYQAEGEIQDSSVHPAAITDSASNTWVTNKATITTASSNQTSQFVYAANASPSQNLSINFTFTNGAAGTTYGLIVLYDVVNAPLSPFDKGATNQGSNTLTSGPTTTISLTPTGLNGLVFSMWCVSWNTANSVSGSTGGGGGFVLDSVVNSLGSNNTGNVGTTASTLDEDAGISHIRPTSSGAVTFIYGQNTSGQAGAGSSAGPGDWSTAAISFLGSGSSTPSPPGTVLWVSSGTSNPTSSSLTLSWQQATDTSVSPSSLEYLLEHKGGSISTFTQFQSPTGVNVLTLIDNNGGAGLVSSTIYSYQMRAFDPANNLNSVSYSATVTGTTSAAVTSTPTVPTGLGASTISSSEIDLSWTQSTDTQVAQSSLVYIIDRSIGSGSTSFTQIAITSAGASSFQDTGLISSTVYNYEISCSNGTHSSAFGPTVTATTLTAPVLPTFVQSNNNPSTASGTSATVAFTSAQHAGDANVILIAWNTTATTVTTVVDTKLNSYAASNAILRNGSLSHQIWTAFNIAAAGANSVTVTFSASSANLDIRILEYSNVSAIDAVAALTGSSALSSSGPLTTTSANDMLVFGNQEATSTTGPGSGFTQRIISGDGNIAEDQLAVTPGSFTGTAPMSGSGAWVGQMVAFKASAPSGTNVSLSGIPSAQAFGTIGVLAPATIAITGIASAQAFGAIVVLAPATVLLTGIASAQAIGGIVAAPSGTVTIAVSGIASAQAFGVTQVTAPDFIAISGILSAEAFGNTNVDSSSFIFVNGIASSEAFGNTIVGGAAIVAITGISSAEALGTITVAPSGTSILALLGIPSLQAFGRGAVSGSGAIPIIISGVVSGEAFGLIGAARTGGATRIGRVL